MKSVLISIQPKWCELIASGKKTIEVRKTKPKIDVPFKVYIYETKGKKQYFSQPLPIPYNEGKGKVIGEFVCDEIFPIRVFENGTIKDYNCHAIDRSCVPYDDIVNYIGNGCMGCGWHISDLVIYDKPKELSEFSRHDNSYDNCFGWVFEDRAKSVPITRPPQSWCHVEELKGGAE